ncbi:hypothetical protein BVY03_06095 [bacterium K02(2017)]|nr:hypothetical protein BVY03_06095 [bacterium K02(2017)]
MLNPFFIILIIYCVATLFYILRSTTGTHRFSALGLRTTIIAALIQLSVLISHIILKPKGLSIEYLESFQFSALIIACIFIFLCFQKRFFRSGLYFLPLIVLFCGLSLWLKTPENLLSKTQLSSYLFVHLIFIFMSLSIFSLAFVLAILFLISERRIKNKQVVELGSLFPSLQTLDKLHYQTLYVGFILFTLVIMTGAGYSKVTTGNYLSGDSKQILSMISWFIFAALLNLRVQKGWQGHRGIILSLAGFVSMIVLFVVGLT